MGSVEKHHGAVAATPFCAKNKVVTGHQVSPAGMRATAEKTSELITRPMPQDLKQVRALLGGVGYYRKFLRDLPSGSARSPPSSGRDPSSCSRPPWRLSCAKFSPSLPLHQLWSSPTGTPWPTAPVPFLLRGGAKRCSLPVTPRGDICILLLIDRFSYRADMYAAVAVEFTFKGTANIHSDRYIPLWGCPRSIL